MTGYTWDHVQLRSAAPEDTAAWFARHFGAEILSGPGRLTIRLDGVDIFVARVTQGDGVLPPPAHPHRGLDHFGLVVPDLDAAVAELTGAGVELAEPVKTLRPGVRGCYVLGPDGIWIELLERKTG
ncbi:VOC family protein [Siculibacillus lacustris]|uniref:VOC family protein n=1 Tax=Siculibacillus lacustris TaxID=1549641 RepID=A0A4Q9VSN9_9HYPH|nr:VOC family protein [Siculibacillus lacustris]TBW39017.1 VOC family protein [Siculibacillus lacustris]